MAHFTAGQTRVLFSSLVLLCEVLLTRAQDLPCSVTQGSGWTIYSIPEFTATMCQYSWANGTSHVVANHEEEIKTLVLSQSSVKLTTNQCLEQVHYKRDCISEGVPCHAVCNTTCNQIAGVHHPARETRHHSCALGIAAFVLLLLGLLAIRYGGKRRSCAGADVDVQGG